MSLPPPPAELAFLTDRIGAEMTLRLIEQHGGTRLHVAKAPTPGSKLARDIGHDAALALAKVWGGDYLKVPLAREWRARVYQSRGGSYAKIARRLGVTEGTVWGYLNQAGMTNRQADLFG